MLADIEPVRFSLFTALFTAIVLGTGLDALRSARSATTAADRGWRTRARQAAPAVAIGVAALLPLVPNWPYPAGPPVTPSFFTTSAATQIPAGTVVAALPIPWEEFNEAMVWQAQTSMRFRLVGGSTFFVPGRGGKGVKSSLAKLWPLGIEEVFRDALRGSPQKDDPPLNPHLLTAIRDDLRKYHIGAVIMDPRFDPEQTMGINYPVIARDLAMVTPPRLHLAVRYITAATSRRPESVGGVLAWLHLGNAG